jgi:ribosomal protein S18 acetylase RimI-like enzyme
MQGYIIEINNLSQKQIENIHKICNDDFIPKLSNRVDISAYSTKLYKNAEIISISNNEGLFGLVAIYCNDKKEKIGYISSVCLLSKYRGKGFAKKLLNESILLSKRKGMKKIRLEVNIKNLPAINLYKKFDFYIIEKGIESVIMERNV